MRIAVNTRLLLADKLEGIGWFTFETLKRMVASHPEDEFIFIFDRPFDSKFIFGPNVIPVVIGPQARHPILFRIWFNWSVTKVLKKHQADVFLSPDGYLSLCTKTPSLAVIHDLNFEHFPEDLKKIHSDYYKKYFPIFAKKATRIATVSEYSKKDIIEQYQVDSNKIDVIHNGVSDQFHPISESEQAKTKEQYTDGKEYFLFVGALHPRKNIGRLLNAFDAFKKESKSLMKLLIVGQKSWWNSDMEANFNRLNYQNDIIFTGRQNQVQLNHLYASALALCFVPYFEGFGIPILEAFKTETAVITANITSMPEVAADAALLVDPFNEKDITSAMLEVSNNKTLRQELINKGIKRVKNFSWDKSAEKLYESILKTVKNA